MGMTHMQTAKGAAVREIDVMVFHHNTCTFIWVSEQKLPTTYYDITLNTAIDE